MNLTDISTTVPLIADGTMAQVRLRNISQTERDGNPVIKWEFALVEPALHYRGRSGPRRVPALHHLRHQPRVPDAEDGPLRRCASWAPGTPTTRKANRRRPQFNADIVSQMIGAEAMAKITVTEIEKSDYVGNDIAYR